MQREVLAPQDVKLGLVPQQSDGRVVVKDVSRGGWAEDVGINAGTRIMKLNGIPVQGMSDTDFKAALKQRPLKILLEQDTFELLVQDPSEKLGCAFAGTPPANTSVSKIAPGSVAERNNIQPGFQLVTVNGQPVGGLTESTFRESLKARPVRLLFQVPKKDQPLVESPKAAGAVVFEVRLEDAATKLGCGFGGLPPDAVAVGKVSPGTFAERNKIQTGYLLVALNGIEMKELNPERFREILKARPVRLRLQIPQSEEKEKIVKEVVKQEIAVTALQAIARGQRVRRQWRARAMQKAQVEVADQTEVTSPGVAGQKTEMEAQLGEAEEGVPLGLDDMPPERMVQQAELERRSLQLQVPSPRGDQESAASQSPAQPQKTEGERGSTSAPSKAPGQMGEKDAFVQDATSEGKTEHEIAKATDPLPTTTTAPRNVPSADPAAGASDEGLQKDFDALSKKLQEREKELLTTAGELAKAKGEVEELRAKLALREAEKKDLLQDAKPPVSQVELDEVKGQLANALQDLAAARSQAEELKQRTEELEDAQKGLREKDVNLVETDRPSASAPPQSPDSAASFEVTPAYWEHVEIHALQEELAQRDAELKALRTDLAAAYAKLKEGDQKLRVTVPKSATTLGFRLQKWLVYEVVKGSWAESVGLKLGDRLQLVQEMQVTKMGKEQLQEAWTHRPLQLTFRSASKAEREGMASTKIQANWRRRKAQEKVGQVGQGKAAGDLGPELDTFTLLAEVEDLGLTLELWPPAPRVLVRSVRREGWAMKAGIKAGYQLLMVQKQSLQSFQDRQSFRQIWKERPLELSLCPGSKEDVQRIASTKIQHGWRSRQPKPKAVEMADQTKGAGVPLPVAAAEATAFPAASMERPWEKLEPNSMASLQQLQDELMQKQLELKKLKQDLAHSESTFEKSLEQISVESSESAVEVASLKAQLALEQSKVAKIQNEGASKATSAHAKFLVEQRKAETLETRLVETEVVHQEQISEITEFLETRRRELQLEDLDFTKLRHPDVPNAPREVERLKAALAEEQERVSSAERKLVKGWSDQRAIDLQWQAEVAARDERLEAMQKEVSKAEWWASLSNSPELKEVVGLKTELEEEREKKLRMERRLEEVQADSKKEECEKLQASLNKEEAGHLQLQLALTKAQIEDEALRNTDLEIPTTPADKVKAEELLRLNLQLQELKGELQEVKVQGPSRTEAKRKARAETMPGLASRTSVPVVKALSREVASSRSLLSRASLRGRASLTDDGLRTKLAVALMRALQDGSLQEHLDKAKTVPRSQVQALRQEVVQLRRQLRTAEVSGSLTPSTPRKSAFRIGTPQSEKQKVNFLADEEVQEVQSLVQPSQLSAASAQEDFRQLMEEKDKLAGDLARAQAKLKDYEERSRAPCREALPEASARTDQQKTEQAIHLNELATKEPLLAQAREEARRAGEEHAAEKERWMKEMAELARPLDLQEEVSKARQLKYALEMRENVATEFRKQLWEVREELQVAESMGFQPNKALVGSENAMGRALREEQDLAKHLRQELSEVETAAITTAEAAEARIIQIEALDRRGRMALHMAETAAEKEAALKDDAIKAACEAEAQVQNMLREVQRMQHEVYEQSQACYRESAVCDGLRRALMNSVEEEMAQEALHAATAASSPKSPRSPLPTPAVPSAKAQLGDAAPVPPVPPVPPQLGRGPSGFPTLPAGGPCASFAGRISREDLKHDLMSPSDVKSWMDPSTISQPSLLSAAAKEAASLRKEAEQLRHEVRHWRASRPLRADPTPPAGEMAQTAPTGTAPVRRSEGSMRSEAVKHREAPSAQVPTLPEQPPPRPPLG